MDVATQHGVHVIALRVMCHSGFEFADETYGVLHSSFCIRAERPEAQTETAPDEVDERIERKEKLVAEVTRKREPLHVLHHGVELMTVNGQNALARSGDVNCALCDLDVSVRAAKARDQLIVISRNVNYAGALAGFAQNFLDHVVVLLWPINCPPQRPDVDQVAHDVQRVEVGLAQKVQQRSGVAAARAQVHVGNPRGAIALWS